MFLITQICRHGVPSGLILVPIDSMGPRQAAVAQSSTTKCSLIGAGLTGVSAASHCVGHGFDVYIFEAGDKNSVGGIWSVSMFQ